jgi:hypothetical protein
MKEDHKSHKITSEMRHSNEIFNILRAFKIEKNPRSYPTIETYELIIFRSNCV